MNQIVFQKKKLDDGDDDLEDTPDQSGIPYFLESLVDVSFINFENEI